MFEEYLREQCEKEGGYDGVLDDDYEDAFDLWLETKDVNDMIDYGENALTELAGKSLGSIKSDKKAQASRENGKKGGRPFMATCDNCKVTKKFTKETYRRENPEAYCYCRPKTPMMFVPNYISKEDNK